MRGFTDPLRADEMHPAPKFEIYRTDLDTAVVLQNRLLSEYMVHTGGSVQGKALSPAINLAILLSTLADGSSVHAGSRKQLAHSIPWNQGFVSVRTRYAWQPPQGAVSE